VTIVVGFTPTPAGRAALLAAAGVAAEVRSAELASERHRFAALTRHGS
jgi:hypothetical protein